jgi:hypothetical protein
MDRDCLHCGEERGDEARHNSHSFPHLPLSGTVERLDSSNTHVLLAYCFVYHIFSLRPQLHPTKPLTFGILDIRCLNLTFLDMKADPIVFEEERRGEGEEAGPWISRTVL